MIIFACAFLACACTLSNGTRSGHTFNQMESYARTMFYQNVTEPAALINTLVSLEEYISASDEEKMSERFCWHRENIFHEDDVTFHVKSIGTVRTYGKSLYDPESCWSLDNGIEISKEGIRTWKVGRSLYEGSILNTTVTYSGLNENGRHAFTVEAYNTEKCTASYFSGETVTAVISTAEGPIKLIEPRMRTNNDNPEPEGRGAFIIETERSGKLLDRMELRYSESGWNLVFNLS